MSHFIRTQIPLRSARAVSMLAGAGVLAAALGGCALVPREPITQQPMTAVPPPPPSLQTPGSIYNPGYAGRPLFEDQRPRNVGDILTIVISENINATKSSGANTNRAGQTAFGVPTAGFLGGLFGKVNLDATGSNTFKATGGANASNTFSGVITVTVIGVQPNGNLLVSGEKQMLINQGNEFVRFSGVVNPNTISSLNAVYSTQVADAKIEYSAKGYINESQDMSWLQRFFLNVAPF
ncbi:MULTISPECIES: flagellar basal body L-ring protein FlgH [Paraburkholderia]|jgi:flagellar L-ring protein precursor FlgH|uniref:Flagellar L-ring protein n=1 Tax=Paraburkholderia hospita TaxID=169430 RepID=A0ABN0FVE3_9BURK|nr:flagellar basal body L-ring protein FlgH [Paraburkholderia hospita]EUC21336.1 Flagellar L-ring protein [Burkholderia sp. BT03]SKC64507.1 Flagellar basal body L-ring protein FlgH [Burkholderia sp. CF099]SOE60921.1 Flagellar basal body L-ring protein FlgH [Burkholderia sp. YR290]AXE99913.1 flagellar basal body L-ring protein [Paraburkholderia hospita]EIN02824.1 flagellar basal body L-ring protein [Paraburkholderia hospita]